MKIGNALLPCPFCGSKSVSLRGKRVLEGYNGLDMPVYRRRCYVRCNKCSSRGPVSGGLILSGEVSVYAGIAGAERLQMPEWATTEKEIINEAIRGWNNRNGG